MIFSQVSESVAFLSEASLVLFDVLSAVFICTLFYFVFVVGLIKIRRQADASLKRKTLIAFPILVAVLLSIVNWLAIDGYLLATCISFVLSLVVFSTFYFRFFRWMLSESDYRIQYTMILWAGLSALELSALIFLVYSSEHLHIEKNFVVGFNMLIQASTIVVSAVGITFTYIMRTEQMQRDARQRLYQTLELQSINLFRFEAEHPDLPGALWFGKSPDNKSFGGPETFDYIVRQYVCQMLNLFEMAVRFRVQGILPPEVFGSWVIWIWELCNSKRFRSYWLDTSSDLPYNYTRELREIIKSGIEISGAGSKASPQTEFEKDRDRLRFFQKVAQEIDCNEIGDWFKGLPEPPLSSISRAHAG